MPLPTRSLQSVEIFAVGTHNGDKYSAEDLDSMVASFGQLRNRMSPPLKLGHNDDQQLIQKDGLPSAGWITNLYRKGEKLLADITGIPTKVAELISTGAYRKRSAEILWDYMDKETGHKHSRVLCGLALLGADLPAVQTLDDILALYGGNAHPNLKAYISDIDINETEEDSAVEDSPREFNSNLYKKEKTAPEVEFRRLGGMEAATCGKCRFFFPNTFECSLVEGLIRKEDVCNLYEQSEMPLVTPLAFSINQDEEEPKMAITPEERAEIEKETRDAVAKEYSDKAEAEKKAAADDIDSKLAQFKEEQGKENDALRAQNAELRDNQDKMEVEKEAEKYSDFISPYQRGTLEYLLLYAGKTEPKKYALVTKDDGGEEKEEVLSYKETFCRFLEGLPKLSETDSFRTLTKNHTEEDDKVWRKRYDADPQSETEQTVATKVEAMVKEHQEKNPDCSMSDALHYIAAASDEGKRLVSIYSDPA